MKTFAILAIILVAASASSIKEQRLKAMSKLSYTSLFTEIQSQITSGGPLTAILDTIEKFDKQIRTEQAEKSFELCDLLIDNYPKSIQNGQSQKGKSTFYKKRNPEDSELDINKSLIENFNLLRTVDNKKYPAFFRYKNNKYILKIEKI